jgi:DNA replication protein
MSEGVGSMSLITKLLTEDMISFVDVILEHYPKMMIDETNVLLLIFLYKQKKQGSHFLSTKILSTKMMISPEECGNRVVDLVQRGFIELEFSTKDEKETFNLKPTFAKMEALYQITEETSKKQEVNQTVKAVIEMVEGEYHRPLTTYELDIINVWVTEEDHPLEDIKGALLESLKAKKTNLRYVDIILINRNKSKKAIPTQKKNEELELILHQVYAKKK